MKKFVSIFVAALLLVSLLAGCQKSDTISVEAAQKVVLQDLGVTADQVQLHVHVGEYEGKPCYSIYVTVNGENLEYLIDSHSGEILAVNHSDHSH